MRAVRAQAIGGSATAWQSMGCAGIVALTLYRFGRPALWIVLVVVLVLVLDLAGFDYDYENDDEEDALRVCRRFT